MKEIEIIEKRKPKEKHFLREDGTMKAIVYSEDIHYLKNGKYEEIDNSIIEEENYYRNRSNSYEVRFDKNKKNLIEINKDGYYLKINLINNKLNKIDINKSEFKCKNILSYVDIDYKVLNNKLKESIILKNKKSNRKILFTIDTNLDLILIDKNIIAKKEEKEYFKIDAPYMIDSNNIENHNISYKLDKINNKYYLELLLDEEWLNNAKYPVIIDPTITNLGNNNSVYDTYIYPGDTNVDRNSLNYIKIGVEKENDTLIPNRALIKFDLPEIATGDQIVRADLALTGCTILDSTYKTTIFAIHPITTEWNENSANWNTMHDKYESRVEGVSECYTMATYENDFEYQFIVDTSEITNLVKHWYTDKPNYGIMIKQNIENVSNSYAAAFCSSKTQAKPCLVIIYRNQNGLENYMDYFSQSFNIGRTYVNNYNGNLTGVFNVGKTIGGKGPVSLDIVYNTNDVILNKNIGYGLGLRLNLSKTVEKVTIEQKPYLKYIDEDGTSHYFYKVESEEENYKDGDEEEIYKDEDGLNYTITDNTDNYVLIDKDSNLMKFNKIGDVAYLTEIKDVENNIIAIFYDSNKRIIKIKDANNAEINLNYGNNLITISNPDGNRILNYNNNKLININSYLGTTSFECNQNNIISKIIDIDTSSIEFNYYDISPYRVKKVLVYGLNNSLGKYYDFTYQFNSTTITDNKLLATTKTFTNNGTLESTTNLKTREDITNAYGKSIKYGDDSKYTNKILESYIPLRTVKNYITNSYFDKATIDFTSDGNATLSLSQEEKYIGANSLKIVSATNSTINRTISIDKGKYYTLSAYLKTNSKAKIAISYTNQNNEIIRSYSNEIENSDDFYRCDTTIYYSSQATTDLKIEVITNAGTTYLDAIQLEEGEVVNQFNIIENSDFKNGYSNWNLFARYHNSIYNFSSLEDYNINDISNIYEVITLDNNKTALKINMNPDYITGFNKTLNVSGKAGDTFTLSLWYKNKGIVSYYGMGYFFYNVIDLKFNYDYSKVTDPAGAPLVSRPFNPNETEWQYFEVKFTALYDYDSIELFLDQELNANEFYITDISLFKNVSSVIYDYDESGNIICSQSANSVSNFKYDNNNQLIKMTNPIGKNLNYEYDNIITNRVLRGITDSGITNKIKYDNNGNPIYTSISKDNVKNIVNGLYKIRLKGTEKYIKFKNNSLELSEDNHSHDTWYFEKVDNYFKIKHSIINDKFITTSNNSVFLSNFNNNSSLFLLIKNDNGSYNIQSKEGNKYLKVQNDIIVISDLIANDSSFEFYIEIPNQLFIQNEATYDDESKYVTSTTDTLLNKTYYDIDSNTGLTKSIINSNGYKTEYTYDSKKQLIKVKNSEKEINYVYNNQNLLSEINNNNVNYKFIYDEFNNTKNVKIGDDVTLITNNYEPNNGNLISSLYGNNQSTSYEYDEFNRIKKMTKMDNVYNYKYGNNGDLIKVIDNDNVYKYTYDDSKRLCEYQNNDFIIKYKYDINDNILNKYYKYNNISHSIENTYNDEESISKTTFDNNVMNYSYDNLGRLINKNINNNLSTNYKYVTNGNRTSLLVDTIEINNTKYKYDYDKLGNIINIYNNDVLEYEYSYDEYNQLLKENNYINNTTTRYKYDNYGNILYKKIYYLGTYNQISQNIYEYKNNSFKDLLTKFNNEEILYDDIGNPINVGNKILTWINGRQLQSYSDSINNITYKYNKDGIRTSKTVNNVKTMYELEGNDIVFEKTGSNMIYYIRSASELIGLKYNDNIYYYIKNNQNDIIGIADSNYNIIANYKYDSFGNIISITDDEGSIITDNNHIAIINPFRYRSYYYDRETNLYYLNSRYYNPEWGRFVNADNYVVNGSGLIGMNMFAYCGNNSIKNIDVNGNFSVNVSNLIGPIKKVLSIFTSKNNQRAYKKARGDVVNNFKKNMYCPNPTGAITFEKTLHDNATNIKNATKGMNPVTKLDYFKNVVNTGSIYDLKVQKEWRGKTIFYDGLWMEDQDIGNYHFGYIGRAVGYDVDFLTFGAGIKQLLSDTRMLDYCFSSSFCDDPRDTYFIKLGAIKYDNEHNIVDIWR